MTQNIIDYDYEKSINIQTYIGTLNHLMKLHKALQMVFVFTTFEKQQYRQCQSPT